jgi:dihydrofolate reductase
VFVLGARRPTGTPDHVNVDDDPVRLLEQVRAASRGGDVHLIGGPRTIETYRVLGAIDELGLIVLPLLLGGGMQLTPSVSPGADLTLKSSRALPTGAVELLYACV